MKRLLSVALLCAAFLCGAVPLRAQGEVNKYPQPTFTTEGRDPDNFNVSCSSTVWTTVRSSDTIRRSLLVQSLQAGTTVTCLALSTGTPAGSSCGTSTLGDQLPQNASITYLSRAALYCMTWLNVTPQTLIGHANRDRGDFGRISSGGD